MELQSKLREAASLILESQYCIALTGAGMSTESGIPDFRGPQGIWTKIDPEIATIDKFLEISSGKLPDPGIIGKFLDLFSKLISAKPNPAHYALAQLERMGKLRAVITQNIDGLHQKAGSKKVIEVHGNIRSGSCLRCGAKYPLQEMMHRFLKLGFPLRCDCSGIIKPDVVFFGESLPRDALNQAFNLARQCDLLMVLGTSLTVYPIAYLVDLVHSRGAKIIIINLEPTQKDWMGDVVIHGKLSQILTQIVDVIKYLS